MVTPRQVVLIIELLIVLVVVLGWCWRSGAAAQA